MSEYDDSTRAQEIALGIPYDFGLPSDPTRVDRRDSPLEEDEPFLEIEMDLGRETIEMTLTPKIG